MATCRSCGDEIVWARTDKGKAIPLDVFQGRAGYWDDGNLERVAGVEALTVRSLGKPTDGKARLRSHWTTCPDAASWRKL
jgi:hypothetical protein